MRKNVSVIFRAPVWDATASLAVIDSTQFVAEAASRHHLSLSAQRAFGRVATCAIYLASWVEEHEMLSLTVNGDGFCGKIHLFANGQLRVCGSLERDVESDEPIEACIGKQGYISVVRDGGDGLPFTGTCALRSGDMTGDIEGYFAESEQRPTAVCLFEREEGERLICGGVFVQPLTGAEKSVFTRAKERVQKCNASLSTEEILHMFGAENAERREVIFQCTCSREKAERAVLSLGECGARTVLKQEGIICVHCHECNTDYKFDRADIEALFENKRES